MRSDGPIGHCHRVQQAMPQLLSVRNGQFAFPLKKQWILVWNEPFASLYETGQLMLWGKF